MHREGRSPSNQTSLPRRPKVPGLPREKRLKRWGVVVALKMEKLINGALYAVLIKFYYLRTVSTGIEE
jgi:hypothetical protein